MENILNWKNTSTSFRDTILDVGCSPFFVDYQLPIQRQLYIKECQINKKIAVSVDATGSLIKPPENSEISAKTQKPKHIFLYNMMGKTELKSTPICQIISQRHTARFIRNWLENTFSKMPPPFEVVCDGSKALILKEYIRACIGSFKDIRMLDATYVFFAHGSEPFHPNFMQNNCIQRSKKKEFLSSCFRIFNPMR